MSICLVLCSGSAVRLISANQDPVCTTDEDSGTFQKAPRICILLCMDVPFFFSHRSCTYQFQRSLVLRLSLSSIVARPFVTRINDEISGAHYIYLEGYRKLFAQSTHGQPHNLPFRKGSPSRTMLFGVITSVASSMFAGRLSTMLISTSSFANTFEFPLLTFSPES